MDPQDTENYTGTYTYSLRINDDYKTKVTGTANTKVQIISTPVTVINPSEIDFGNLTAGTSNNGESYIELDQPCSNILNQNVNISFENMTASGGKKIGKEQITANVNLVSINSTHCNVTFAVILNVLDPQDIGNYTGTYTYFLRINDDYKTKVTGTANTKVQIISTPVTVINPSEIDFGNLTAGTSNNGESYIELDQPCINILDGKVNVTFTQMTTQGGVIFIENIKYKIYLIPINQTACNITINATLNIPEGQKTGNYTGTYTYSLRINDDYKTKVTGTNTTKVHIISTPVKVITPAAINFGNLTEGINNTAEISMEVDTGLQGNCSQIYGNVNVEFSDLTTTGASISKNNLIKNITLTPINATACNITITATLNIPEGQKTGNYTGTYTYSLRINDDYKTKVTGTNTTKVHIISTPVKVITPAAINFGNLTEGINNTAEISMEVDTGLQGNCSQIYGNVNVEFSDLTTTGASISKNNLIKNITLTPINATACNITITATLNIPEGQKTGNYTGTYTYSLRINDDYKTKVTGTNTTKVHVISTPIQKLDTDALDFVEVASGKSNNASVWFEILNINCSDIYKGEIKLEFTNMNTLGDGIDKSAIEYNVTTSNISGGGCNITLDTKIFVIGNKKVGNYTGTYTIKFRMNDDYKTQVTGWNYTKVEVIQLPSGVNVCVYDKDTKEIIEGVNVSISNSTDTKWNYTTKTGCYIFDNISQGNYNVKASKTTYPEYDETEYLSEPFYYQIELEQYTLTICTFDEENASLNQTTIVLRNSGNTTIANIHLGDKENCYKFRNLAADNYTSVITKEKYKEEIVNISFAGNVSLYLNITLNYPPSIQGYVIDNITGERIQNATVELYKEGVLITINFTDEKGKYMFIPSAIGNYSINVSKIGYNSMEEDFSKDSEFGTFYRNETFVYNFSLTSSITPYLQICVKDNETNETLSDALVKIYKDSTNIASNLTNMSGCVRFYNISAGTYTLKASKHGYEESEGQIEYDGAILLQEIELYPMKGIKVCVVEVNSITNITTPIVKANITTPIVKANVTLFNSTFSASGETDSKGCYRFVNISYGNYSINATAKGYVPNNGMAEYLGDTNLTIELTPLPRITVCVYDNEVGNESTGKRISNATVLLYNETLSLTINGTTDNIGCYKFMQEYVGQIPNGTYNTTASATHYGSYGLITPYFNNTGDMEIFIGLVKEPRIVINVTYGNNGSPIQNVSVTLYNETWNETKFTNEEGIVEFFVPAGNYSFNVALLGSVNVFGNIGFSGTVHYFQPATLQLVSDICGDVSNIEILEEGDYGVPKGMMSVNVKVQGKLKFNVTADIVSKNGTIVGTFNLTNTTSVANTTTTTIYYSSYNMSNLNEIGYALRIYLNDQCNTSREKDFNVIYECTSPTDPKCAITSSLENNNIAYCGGDNGCVGSISEGKGYKTDYGNRYELYSTIVWNYADEMENLSTVNFTKLTDVINWQAATSMVKVGSSYYIAYEDYSNNNHNPKIRFIYLSSANATYQNVSFEISQQGMRYYYPAMTYDNSNIYLVYMGRGEGDLQASLYYRECTPSVASLSCTNEEKIADIPTGDAKEPAIARYNGKTYIAYANNSDIYVYTKEDRIIRNITHFAEKRAFNWNYSINNNPQELKDYLKNNFGVTWIASETPNITENEIKFTNVTLTLKNEFNHTYYVLADILNKGKYVLKVKKEDIIEGNITVYGDPLCEVETKGQKMNMTCEAHHPNIIFKDGKLYASFQVDIPLLDIIELIYPVKDKTTGNTSILYFVKAPLTDNRIYVSKYTTTDWSLINVNILHKAVSAEGVKKSDFDNASFDTATFSSIKNPWLFEFNNSVYVSVDATDAPYVWKYNESSTSENVVNLNKVNITKTINMNLVKYGGTYTKCIFNNIDYTSSLNINKKDTRGYSFSDPVINLTINASTSELKVKVGDDEITLTIDGNNITTVAPEGVLSENTTLNNNVITLKLNKSYYIKKIDDLETIGERDFIEGKYVYNITLIVGNDTEQKNIIKLGNISMGELVAPNIRDEDVRIVNLKDKGELHTEDTVYLNVSLKNREGLPAVVKVFFTPYVINENGSITNVTPTPLQLGDPNMDLIFDNQGIENGFGGVGVEGTPYVLPSEVANKTTYYLNVTVVIYDMCCNFQVWNKVLTITKKGTGASGEICLTCQPQPHQATSTGGGGLPPTVTEPVTTTEGVFRSATVTNYTLTVGNVTAMKENESFTVKVINETYTYNITYKQINTTNGTRWVEVNKTLIKSEEIPVANANVDYAGQTAVTGTDGTAVIPKAVLGVYDIRATKGGAEARTPTVVEAKKPTTVKKEILIVTLLKGEDKEKEGIYEFEVRDKQGNLAVNRELVVRLPNNVTQKVVTDEHGRFGLTINQSGYITIDQQEYANYSVEHFALPVEIEKELHNYWIWLLLLLPILLLIYLILFMMKGKVEITKERRDGKVTITMVNKTHKTLDACMLEDIIPLGLQIEIITHGLEKTAMGDTLIMNLGNLKKGEKRIAEYKIINAEGIKGAGAKGLPEAKVVWSNGEQQSKNT
ncbi:hypothetical protein MSIBF_A2000005 [groundwater metagenome]|uniref:Uncharacterized protein n=1 Tax=groundwater metagenome TaxID=717931 RepID=A0A098E9H9_9ZZZZ